MNDLDQRLYAARRFACEAGEITLSYFLQEGVKVERKADDSPVTIADREAEMYLRQRIQSEFPDDGILGEELGEIAGTSGYRWILDPIDGTKSFICGVPLYGTLIGVERDGRSDIGVICIPALREGAFAARGRGAWSFVGDEMPQRAHVAQKQKLSDCVFLTSEVKTFANQGRAAAYEALQNATWIGRTWGDCYGYLLVATGRADVMIDPQMSVWDCAALQPIIEEAGGVFTDWSGTPTIHGGEAIATNNALLPPVLEITRKFGKK